MHFIVLKYIQHKVSFFGAFVIDNRREIIHLFEPRFDSLGFIEAEFLSQGLDDLAVHLARLLDPANL